MYGLEKFQLSYIKNKHPNMSGFLHSLEFHFSIITFLLVFLSCHPCVQLLYLTDDSAFKRSLVDYCQDFNVYRFRLCHINQLLLVVAVSTLQVLHLRSEVSARPLLMLRIPSASRRTSRVAGTRRRCPPPSRGRTPWPDAASASPTSSAASPSSPETTPSCRATQAWF